MSGLGRKARPCRHLGRAAYPLKTAKRALRACLAMPVTGRDRTHALRQPTSRSAVFAARVPMSFSQSTVWGGCTRFVALAPAPQTNFGVMALVHLRRSL